MKDLRLKLYQEVSDFLNFFILEDKHTLENRYGISEDFLEEMNEIICRDVTENKNNLSLFPVSEIDKRSNSREYLSIDESYDGKYYIIECDVWVENKPSDLIVIAVYHLDNSYPEFEFRCFDT